jgi:molybdate transport system regulatory protein
MPARTATARKAKSPNRPKPQPASSPRGAVSLTIKLDVSGRGGLGPGKIRLLELVGELGSISAAGRAIPMSYRRAWLMVESLNQLCGQPVVVGKHGGSRGGGAELTPRGRQLIECYRTMQAKADRTFAGELRELGKLLNGKE